MQHELVAENLRFLCTLFPSVAHVCRRLHLNRQQFNKYLSGQVRPSRHNMRTICDFFGVTESEMHMETSRLSEIMSLKRRQVLTPARHEPLAHLQCLYEHSAQLERYVGYYFRYHYSFSYPGSLIKSFARISERDGRYYWHTVERIKHEGSFQKPVTSNYKGALFFLADRIFVIEYHSTLRNSITEMILYPSYHTRIAHLIGIQTGAASVRGRRPAASRVLLEYLGQHIDVKKALRSVGLFHEGSGAIPPTIRELVRNQISDGSFVLEVSEV